MHNFFMLFSEEIKTLLLSEDLELGIDRGQVGPLAAGKHKRRDSSPPPAPSRKIVRLQSVLIPINVFDL